MAKKGFKKYIFYIIVLLFVAFIVALPFLVETTQSATEAKASILSGTAETGDVSTTISGTGTLTEQDAVEITIPDDVKITEFLVNNGDFVTEGTELARVDRVSVLYAISEIQDSMDTVASEMVTAADSTATSSVMIQSTGRVKAIYAKSGDSVQEVMENYGALALVSLDGKMAVDIPNAANVSAGETVTVTLSSGKQIEGKIETVSDGTAIITMTDDGTSLGETVTIAAQSGETIGSGELYIHSPWAATGITGTVSSVLVSENQQVYYGCYLFTLTNNNYTGEYETLANTHRDYEEMIARLFQWYEDGTIEAETAGCVSGIDKTIAIGTANTSEAGNATLLSSTSGVAKITLLSCTGMPTVKLLDAESGSNNSEGEAEPTPTTTDEGIAEGRIIKIADNGNIIIGFTTFYFSKSYYVNDAAVSTQDTIEIDPASVTLFDAQGMTIDAKQLKTGDTILIYFTTTDDGSGKNSFPASIQQKTSSGGGGNIPSGGGSGTVSVGGMSMGGTTTTSTTTLFSTDETTIMSITPQDTVTVTITVDELDVLSLEVGQKATVTIDALPGQSFEGTLTALNTTASNNGGNTKFTADVTMDRNLSMLGGMNASVLITISTEENAVTVPAAAITDLNGKTVVYTGYDKKNETLTDPVEVETGVSDGTTVEIISGLSAGDVYWYAYYDTAE